MSNLLISNDDGIDAQGLAVLERALEGFGTLWTVAPESERSAQSHALTMQSPLRVTSHGPRRFAISGTPADCVYLGIHHLLPERPTAVISGVNHGQNLGSDVFYSGTVAAAMEGCLQGVPAIAFSLLRDEDGGEWQWETAAIAVRRIVTALLQSPPPKGVMWTVNVPSIPPSAYKGVAAATLGDLSYEPLVTRRQDPRGKDYYWIGGRLSGRAAVPGTDCGEIVSGYATITALRADWTDREAFPALRSWTDR